MLSGVWSYNPYLAIFRRLRTFSLFSLIHTCSRPYTYIIEVHLHNRVVLVAVIFVIIAELTHFAVFNDLRGILCSFHSVFILSISSFPCNLFLLSLLLM